MKFLGLIPNVSWIFFAFTFLISTSSFSETVCAGATQNSALIIIDMQTYFLNRSEKPNAAKNKAKVEQMIKEQITAINQAKKANIPIVFVEYEHPVISNSEAGSLPQLKTAVEDYKDVKVVKKTSDGIFEDSNKYRKDLVDYLSKKTGRNIDNYGANGGACVRASIKSALAGDCTVVADCRTAFNSYTWWPTVCAPRGEQNIYVFVY